MGRVRRRSRAKDYSFDLDNWLNDVDVRELILEALPMFSREEMGDHALKLDQADAAFKAGTRDFKHCVWGNGTPEQGEMDAAEELVVLPHADRAPTRSSKTSWRRCELPARANVSNARRLHRAKGRLR